MSFVKTIIVVAAGTGAIIVVSYFVDKWLDPTKKIHQNELRRDNENYNTSVSNEKISLAAGDEAELQSNVVSPEVVLITRSFKTR